MRCFFAPRIVDDQEEQRAQREAGVASLVQSSTSSVFPVGCNRVSSEPSLADTNLVAERNAHVERVH